VLKALSLDHQRKFLSIPYRGELNNNKENKMIAEELTKMLETAVHVTENQNITDETAEAAEDCIQSLLKSMAVHGFDKVKEDKHG